MKYTIFAILKIIEVAAFIFVPYWVGVLVTMSGSPTVHGSKLLFITWILGLICTGIAAGVVAFAYGVYRFRVIHDIIGGFINLNLRWAEKITAAIQGGKR